MKNRKRLDFYINTPYVILKGDNRLLKLKTHCLDLLPLSRFHMTLLETPESEVCTSCF